MWLAAELASAKFEWFAPSGVGYIDAGKRYT
jgi:hypothetical protein